VGRKVALYGIETDAFTPEMIIYLSCTIGHFSFAKKMPAKLAGILFM